MITVVDWAQTSVTFAFAAATASVEQRLIFLVDNDPIGDICRVPVEHERKMLLARNPYSLLQPISLRSEEVSHAENRHDCRESR